MKKNTFLWICQNFLSLQGNVLIWKINQMFWLLRRKYYLLNNPKNGNWKMPKIENIMIFVLKIFSFLRTSFKKHFCPFLFLSCACYPRTHSIAFLMQRLFDEWIWGKWFRCEFWLWEDNFPIDVPIRISVFNFSNPNHWWLKKLELN